MNIYVFLYYLTNRYICKFTKWQTPPVICIDDFQKRESIFNKRSYDKHENSVIYEGFTMIYLGMSNIWFCLQTAHTALFNVLLLMFLCVKLLQIIWYEITLYLKSVFTFIVLLLFRIIWKAYTGSCASARSHTHRVLF